MITLYGFGRIFPEGRGHTKDLRAQWALEEIGLPCRVHALDHTGGELGSEACRRRSADIVEINYLSESDLHWLLGTLNPGSMRAEHAEAYEAIATYQKLFDTFAKVAPNGEAPTKVVRSSKQAERTSADAYDLTSFRAWARARIMSRKRGRREDADRAVEIISAIMALLRQFVVYERRGKNDMLCTARNIIPEGSLGAVVMDATAGNSPVYDLMKAKRYPAIEGTRNYSNGTLHVGIAEQLGLRKMVENGKAKAAELMNDIKHRLPAVTPSGTRVFVTCHKDNRAHVAGHAHEFESMHVAHYGQIDGENGWKDCNHVVQFGLHYRADTDASGSFMAFEGTPKTAKWFSVTSWRSTG